METRDFAGVVVDQAHSTIDRIFHYRIPHEIADDLKIGMRVLVPFGRRDKGVEGYVLQINREIDIPEDRLKSIKRILDPYPVLLDCFIPLVFWMKEEYHCLTIEAIRCMLPPGLRMRIKGKTRKIVHLLLWDGIDEVIEKIEKSSVYMAEILRVLDQTGDMPLAELAQITGAPNSSFKNLEKRGYIKLQEEEVFRDPWEGAPLDTGGNNIPLLTEEQDRAVKEIYNALLKGSGMFLLHGVTGSGKTEVYIKAIEKALGLKKQAIVLVPEISLTPQTVSRFKNRFGDQVAILHSGLSLGERYDEWRRIRNNKVNIVVGARSAVFAPLERLGIIIIDESHEDSYKSNVRPRYHAVEVAKKRCSMEKAVLVLGSATPNLEDSFLAEEGVYRRIRMNHRIENRPMPPAEIVDMRQELYRGNRSIFSNSLYTGIEAILKKNEQAILLLNRRGYAQFVSCRSCGFVIKCSSCDISLTYHAHDRILRCHYCGYEKRYPSYCPQCRSKYIKNFGIGTQKVEEEINRFFPNSRVIRMDMDTTSNKGAHQKILRDFGRGEYDILLGTQMIAKGLDFPHVTLVGVISADTSLNLPDYRSSEKTFQLITQVAGRTGRGISEGRVIIQSYQPEHYALQYAAMHDYNGFYNKEIEIRRKFQYPPFSHIIRILVTGESEKSVVNLAVSIKEWIVDMVEKDQILKQGMIDIGAYMAPLGKIKNKFRWHIIIRTGKERVFLEKYHRLMDSCISKFSLTQNTVVVDFNPVSLL